MVEQKSSISFLRIFPKCPYYTSIIVFILTTVLITLGAIGLYFLNVWVAIGYVTYSISYIFLAMPIKHCQYCYYKVQDPTLDNKTGKLLPLDKYHESYFPKHVICAKKWANNLFIIWFLPIVLIVISFFLSFEILALIALLGFIVVLAVQLIYTRQKVCTTCAIQEECHAAF